MKEITKKLFNLIDNLNSRGLEFKKSNLIGEGNFGEVYQGVIRQPFTGDKRVAIKKFKFVDNDSELRLNDAKHRFNNEAIYLKEITETVEYKRLSNVKIPKYIAYFTLNEDSYIVQEFIDGQNLKTEFTQTKLSEEAITQLLRDVLKSISFLHDLQIIHRDISPKNIIFSKNNGYFLIDFGAAKKINSSLQTEGTQILNGHYSPKEQLEGEYHFSSDIYALGVTAIESYLGVFNKFTSTTNAVERLKQSTMDRNLIYILEKMTQEKAEDRYYSARNVLDDLDRITGTIVISPKKQEILTENNTEIQNVISVSLRTIGELQSGFIRKNNPGKPLFIFSTLIGFIVLMLFMITRHSITKQIVSPTSDIQETLPTPAPAKIECPPFGIPKSGCQ